MTRIYAMILSFGAAIIALDQWTKQLILETFTREGESKAFLGWWNFTLVYNRGAAFGLFRGLPESIRVGFFLLLPVIVLFLMWWFYVRKFTEKDRLGPIAMGLVLGGALGNLVDRIRHGHVIDFIDWFYRSEGSCLPQFHKFTAETCHWPVFNVADSAISVAMVLLIAESLFEGKLKKS